MDTCQCGHEDWSHRPHIAPTLGRSEPVIVVRRGECQSRERVGRTEYVCECPRYSPPTT